MTDDILEARPAHALLVCCDRMMALELHALKNIRLEPPRICPYHTA
jgi:hypothetical protein